MKRSYSQASRTFILVSCIADSSEACIHVFPFSIRSRATRLLVALHIHPPAEASVHVHGTSNPAYEHQDNNKKESSYRSCRVCFPIDFVTAPPSVVLLLLAMGVLSSEDVRSGIAGTGGVHPLSIMALFLSLVRCCIASM